MMERNDLTRKYILACSKLEKNCYAANRMLAFSSSWDAKKYEERTSEAFCVCVNDVFICHCHHHQFRLCQRRHTTSVNCSGMANAKIKIMNKTNNYYYSNGSVIMIVEIRSLYNGWLNWRALSFSLSLSWKIAIFLIIFCQLWLFLSFVCSILHAHAHWIGSALFPFLTVFDCVWMMLWNASSNFGQELQKWLAGRRTSISIQSMFRT